MDGRDKIVNGKLWTDIEITDTFAFLKQVG